MRRLLERRFIHEERPNLRLNLDLDAMSADDRSHASALLREALDRLSPLDRGTTLGPMGEEAAAPVPDGRKRPAWEAANWD